MCSSNFCDGYKKLIYFDFYIKNRAAMGIDDLPLETLISILKRTDGCTLAKCREVCKRWRDTVDGTHLLWQEFCEREYKYSSKIAKRKAGEECEWYHIYRNLKMWSKITLYKRKLKGFYKFNLHDECHVLDSDYNVLPIRDTKGFILYEINTLKYIPVALPDRNCKKIASNDHTTVMLTDSQLFLQRTVYNKDYKSEGIFKADDFVLTNDTLYFYYKRDIYKCNLNYEDFIPILEIHCFYDIKEMVVNDEVIYLFTDCGKIITVKDEYSVSQQSLNIPLEWIKQVEHIRAFDDKNFVCYSRNLFKIKTHKYQHLYLDFPLISALFFYGDIVIIGTRAGEVLIYRVSSQKQATKPIFENLAVLPDGRYAVHLDVCERRSGPVIIVATIFEIMFLEVDFFPNELEPKKSFTLNKRHLYKRLLKLRDKLNNT